MSETSNSDLERKLQGRTLRVYLYLQKKKVPSGIREVQRDLALSSPSVADYQLEKLVEMGLATRDGYGRVYVVRNVRVKALQSYVSVGHFLVPRFAFYATSFTAITAFYLAMSADSANLYVVAVPAAAAGIFWFEALKMWHVQLGDRRPEARQKQDNRDFWVALLPGMAALAVFIAAAFFLFYYVEPNQVAPEIFPVNPDLVSPASPSLPMTIDDIRDLNAERVDSPASHAEIVKNFPMTLVTGFLFAGAVVVGFVVYLLVKYRRRDAVLMVERS